MRESAKCNPLVIRFRRCKEELKIAKELFEILTFRIAPYST